MKKLLVKNSKWFVLILLVSIIVWNNVFSYLNRVKDYQQLQIFITADNVNTQSIIKTTNKNEIFKDVKVYSCRESDTYYSSILETSGIMSSDILIVNEELIKTSGATTSFIELDKQYLANFYINLDLYELVYVNEKAYGIVIYDKLNNINLLNDYIFYTEESDNNRYCLCLNNISYHIGDYSLKKENLTTNAFIALANLLNLK